jgi:hypothetical protein
MTLEGIVEQPTVRMNQFKNLDAALDFCKFIRAEEIGIRKIINGVESIGWEVSYVGSEGQR